MFTYSYIWNGKRSYLARSPAPMSATVPGIFVLIAHNLPVRDRDWVGHLYARWGVGRAHSKCGLAVHDRLGGDE